MRKLTTLILLVLFVVVISACRTATKPNTTTAQGTTAPGTTTTPGTTTAPVTINPEAKKINVSLTYNGKNFITYKESTPYVLPNGTEIKSGDLLPAWKEFEKILDLQFTDVTLPGKKAQDVFRAKIMEDFAGIDIINGTTADFNDAGLQGKLVALDKYFNYMPNFKQFLDDNPAVKKSITSSDGHIYFTTYFDGFNEIERMFLIRNDFVRALLDETNPTFDTAKTLDSYYTPFYTKAMMTNQTVTTKNKTIIKNLTSDSDNVIARQNALSVKNGDNLCSTLRTYIDEKYFTAPNANVYQKRSDLFISVDAAYDADELIALMRCAKTNPKYLTNDETNEIAVFFPRENKDTRTPDVVRLAQIWGVRGLDSESGFTWIDKDNKVRDARGELDYMAALTRLNTLYKEGLIVQGVDIATPAVNYRQNFMSNGTAFMTYDYNGTTALVKESTAFKNATFYNKDKFEFEAMLPAVNNWFDEGYIHFSESTRAVKNEGWAVPKHVESQLNGQKLTQVLKLMDFMFTDEGENIQNFGPKGLLWEAETLNYKGEMYPEFNAKALEEIAKMGYTQYMRAYIGSTLGVGHIRPMAAEYQTLNDMGRKSIEKINNSGLFLIKMGSDSNPAKNVPPSLYPYTKAESKAIADTAFFQEEYTDNFIYFVTDGTIEINGQQLTPEQWRQSISTKGYTAYMLIHQNAWDRIKD